MNNPVPVIAIDGPAASGKGTVAQLVAEHFGFHYLDSGAIYRAAAYAARQQGVALDDEPALTKVAEGLDLRFAEGEIYLSDQVVSDAVRSEATGLAASQVSAFPALRAALMGRQRAFRQAPGLVADGRDMGSVVFPDACLKVFLTASAEARSERRHKQLIEKGISANIATLLQDLRERDARDSQRAVAPLQRLPDAALLDTTGLGINEAVEQIVKWYGQCLVK